MNLREMMESELESYENSFQKAQQAYQRSIAVELNLLAELLDAITFMSDGEDRRALLSILEQYGYDVKSALAEKAA